MALQRESASSSREGWEDGVARLWAAGSCWIMSVLFIVAWWWPRALDNGRWVKLGVGMLALEFILVHSSALVSAAAAQKTPEIRARAMLGLTGLYALFAIAIALVFRSWEIWVSFAVVMSGRLWSVFGEQSAADRSLCDRRTAASIVLYVGLTFATVFIPVPRGGITDSLADEVWPTRKTGLWERHPEKALAMGALYFLLLGVVEARPPRS